MSEMVERLALRLFWRAEHLDPSADGDALEGEHGNGWPHSLNERKREFWRLLAKEAIITAREPTQAMIEACGADDYYDSFELRRQHWETMINEALR